MSYRRQQGVSLLEVLVSTFIFLSAMAAFSPALLGTINKHNVTMYKTGAYQVAQQQLDALRQQNISALPNTGTQGPVNVMQDGRSYQVYTTYCAQTSFCASSSTRGISVSVYYKNNKVYEVETVFTQLG